MSWEKSGVMITIWSCPYTHSLNLRSRLFEKQSQRSFRHLCLFCSAIFYFELSNRRWPRLNTMKRPALNLSSLRKRMSRKRTSYSSEKRVYFPSSTKMSQSGSSSFEPFNSYVFHSCHAQIPYTHKLTIPSSSLVVYSLLHSSPALISIPIQFPQTSSSSHSP